MRYHILSTTSAKKLADEKLEFLQDIMPKTTICKENLTWDFRRKTAKEC